MSENVLREKGIEYARLAIGHESKKNYADALSNYEQAIELLIKSQKWEKSDQAKKVVQEHILNYLEHAEQLKATISTQKPATETAIGVSPDGKNGSSGTSDEDKAFSDRIMDAAVVDRPNVKWSDVAGLESVKQALIEAVIFPLKMKQLFVNRLKPWAGILLFGPPGTGKTMLAKAVATEAKANLFLQISVSKILGKYVGESERMVGALFKVARKNRPCIIFCDEVDALVSKRSEDEHEVSRKVKNAFLEEMDGCGTNNEGVLIIAATNMPWMLDDAFMRRFQKKIYIPLPSVETRALIVKAQLSRVPHSLGDQEIERIADECDNFTGSDMQTLTSTAQNHGLSLLPGATHFRLMVPTDTSTTANFSVDNDNLMLEPCSPGHQDAIELSFNDLEQRDWLHRVQLPPVSMSDYMYALSKVKTSPLSMSLSQYEDFTNKFGERGDS
jgi:vacuolar protein-sorting-associated protein 4